MFSFHDYSLLPFNKWQKCIVLIFPAFHAYSAILDSNLFCAYSAIVDSFVIVSLFLEK